MIKHLAIILSLVVCGACAKSKRADPVPRLTAPTQPSFSLNIFDSKTPAPSASSPQELESLRTLTAMLEDFKTIRIPPFTPKPKSMKRILIAGAGPIGLLAAIGQARRGNQVAIVESRAFATRSQVVLLDHASQAQIEHVLGRKAFAMLQPKYLGMSFKGKAAIRISDLENFFTAYITHIDPEGRQVSIHRGISFQNGELKSAQGTSYSHDASLIIGADGARSEVRKAMGIKSQPAITGTDYVLAVEFDLKGREEDFDAWLEGKNRDNLGVRFAKVKPDQLTVRYSCTAEEFAAINALEGEAKRREILKLVTSKLDEVAPQFSSLALIPRPAPTDISAFMIELQRAERATGNVGKTPAVLLGDSYATVHFSSSSGINKGFSQLIDFETYGRGAKFEQASKKGAAEAHEKSRPYLRFPLEVPIKEGFLRRLCRGLSCTGGADVVEPPSPEMPQQPKGGRSIRVAPAPVQDDH